MKQDHPARHFLVPLLAAGAIYVLAYGGIEYLRNRKGPWEVTFTRAPLPPGAKAAIGLPVSTEFPALIINQPALKLANVQLIFINQPSFTNPPSHLIFRQPKPVPYDLPFGKCIFMDTTFLPGTLTVQMFGHEVELLPRVLIIDHEEHAWHSGEGIMLGTVPNPPGLPAKSSR